MAGKEGEKWKQLLQGVERPLPGLSYLLPPSSAKVVTFLQALQCTAAAENPALGV